MSTSPPPTVAEAQRSLSDHVRRTALDARALYGPSFDQAALERLLEDRRCCRFPTRIVFDAAGLEPGTFSAAEPLGDDPREGYVIRVHPRFERRPLLLPLLVAYQLVVVNYGDIATHEEAELFGATLLGLSVDDYYQTLCLVADSLE
ncbi:MAG: hypothetical protein EP329_28760 [Deltaproteobacteria bacterium]|nr:MAG: hypothetical protein EP329_28760 [Deltaproteobacteria bacterium]